jgi:type III pantothenate kinase
MRSFLVLDVGNTRLKWAIYESLAVDAPILAQGAVFLENIETLAEVEWGQIIRPAAMLGSTVAADAVRRRVDEQLEEAWDLAPRWIVPSAAEAGVVNGYDHPARLGADRWVALIGARQHVERHHPGKACLVVMVGTAVTVDALDAQGRFLGGCILPGHGIMLRALESGTAGLHVPTGEVREFPTNTSDALTSGGNYAIAGAVTRMHQHLSHRAGHPPLVLMTGGAAWKVRPVIEQPVELVDNLIFEGLLRVARCRGL